ncbi:hypothetical protein JRO89_XS04G0022000 [Xanthoceras sorbifolium]|uniref:Uncharacterized protein n=1 Tax=Xanthoceras sorbifolium TaxID=99658 RepID=A0ABQ8I4E5_9ROSI|nr:hypothetical protein JRO89_XS04G0022000 [Xanthoceras sorbifolium]
MRYEVVEDDVHMQQLLQQLCARKYERMLVDMDLLPLATIPRMGSESPSSLYRRNPHENTPPDNVVDISSDDDDPSEDTDDEDYDAFNPVHGGWISEESDGNESFVNSDKVRINEEEGMDVNDAVDAVEEEVDHDDPEDTQSEEDIMSDGKHYATNPTTQRTAHVEAAVGPSSQPVIVYAHLQSSQAESYSMQYTSSSANPGDNEGSFSSGNTGEEVHQLQHKQKQNLQNHLHGSTAASDSLQKLLLRKAVFVDEDTFAKASLSSEQARTIKVLEQMVETLERELDNAIGAAAHARADKRQAEAAQKVAELRAQEVTKELENTTKVFELHMEELRAKQQEISKRDEEIKLLEAIIQKLGGKESRSTIG